MDVEGPLPANHAHHFLSRLDRVSRRQVELALSIYRDVALLRFVLDHADLPHRADRVALSLDHPRRGPFIIVTRTGRFVTCLRVGMRAGHTPVVTRATLDRLIACIRPGPRGSRKRFDRQGDAPRRDAPPRLAA